MWWLRAEQPATLRADLSALAVALGLVAAEAEEADAITALSGWLGRNGRWLLIADNAPDRDAVADLVRDGTRGHVLITSRAHAGWRALGAVELSLGVWEREESRAFLTERTGERDDAVLDRVADALGDLPLALEQACGYVEELAITLDGYLGRLAERAPELFAAARPVDYEHTVATVWQLAFERVAEHPVAARLMGVCAYLAPEQIPREALEALSDIDETVSARDVDDAVRVLLGYALLSAGADATVSMHRLVGRLARSRETGEDRRAAVTTVALLEHLWPQGAWEHEQWPACRRMLAHALAATGHTRAAGLAPRPTADLLVRVAQYLQERSQHPDAREHAEHAVALYEHEAPVDAARLASALDVLGTILTRLVQFAAARDVLQRALATATAVYGDKHHEIARTLGNLGLVQQDLGEFEAARASQQRALAIKEAVYGPEHPEVARTLGNLGNVQRQLWELEAARASQQRALAIKEAVYGPEHPEVAITLTNLGNVQRQLGEFDAARASQQRALAINEAVYGPDHPQVASTLNNLGEVQRQLGELEAARASQQRALAIKEAVYGPEHPEVAITRTNLGIVHQQLGELAAARECAQRAVAIFERSLGPEHPYTATARALLASVGARRS